MKKIHWTQEEHGFFGKFYQKGDNSRKGYLERMTQTLEQRTKSEVEGVMYLLGLPPWSSPRPSICDCPCGIGRHSIKLSQMGFTVVAVDLNWSQLVVGKEKTKNKPSSQRPIFVQKDMRDLTFAKNLQDLAFASEWISRFDAVINMFFSFGFFETDEENTRVAQNFFHLLKPGGKFLMHTDVNMARVRNGKYKFTEVRPLQNGQTLEIMERFNPRTRRIEGVWEIGDGKHRCEAKQYSVRVYENEEFVALCKEVGFKDVKIYSDWSGSPYSEDSEMVIFVAEK